jgi:hypothetical protein
MTFQIETGIPVPAARLKYPWDELDIEESFFVRDGNAGTISTSARNYAKKNGVRFVVRKVEGGVRVWRTE